jgi:hypothetical protein
MFCSLANAKWLDDIEGLSTYFMCSVHKKSVSKKQPRIVRDGFR